MLLTFGFSWILDGREGKSYHEPLFIERVLWKMLWQRHGFYSRLRIHPWYKLMFYLYLVWVFETWFTTFTKLHENSPTVTNNKLSTKSSNDTKLLLWCLFRGFFCFFLAQIENSIAKEPKIQPTWPEWKQEIMLIYSLFSLWKVLFNNGLIESYVVIIEVWGLRWP